MGTTGDQQVAATAPNKFATIGMVTFAFTILLVFPNWPLLGYLPLVLTLIKVFDGSKVNGFALFAVWSLWHAILLYPLFYLTGEARFIVGATYLPFLGLYPYGGAVPFEKRNFFGQMMIRICWDPSLLATAFIFHLLGMRLFQPFVTVLDSEIIIASFPFPSDVHELSKKYNVGAVVNMCIEYPGPVAEYKKYNIEQLRLPTVDTTAPEYEDILKGITFITQFLEKNKGKRVLIHCKGGRGRAATMVLSYYLSKGKEVKATFDWLKSQRKEVVSSILKYSVVHKVAQRFGNTQN
eukprot:TRINITY_DN4886_c0_g1_i1.p1 TRINITY_DN4886_c0_g1~~TRINITY_DN4886_c0_g1_i1.p1  ORF type:complete len:294 (-),score=45.25 TRINITY_DN4886_c0_g1_i1:36-917(-)